MTLANRLSSNYYGHYRNHDDEYASNELITTGLILWRWYQSRFRYKQNLERISSGRINRSSLNHSHHRLIDYRSFNYACDCLEKAVTELVQAARTGKDNGQFDKAMMAMGLSYDVESDVRMGIGYMVGSYLGAYLLGDIITLPTLILGPGMYVFSSQIAGILLQKRVGQATGALTSRRTTFENLEDIGWTASNAAQTASRLLRIDQIIKQTASVGISGNDGELISKISKASKIIGRIYIKMCEALSSAFR